MCGVSVIINQKNKPVSPGWIKSMNDKIIHRGPDAEGFYYGDCFAFGSRRLAILDLSPDGDQPMDYLDRYVISYNGEIYNYLELRTQLENKGYTFESKTDTEVVLACYDHYGQDCVKHFNGMWAFAIYDKKKNVIFCSRDRFGIKPFYYSLSNQLFCLASEIKQFTTLPHWTSKLNKTKAKEFLSNGWTEHSEETCFQNVFQLRPGHNLVYDLYRHEFYIEDFYQIKKKIHEQSSLDISDQEGIDQFRTMFTSAVQLRLRADVKIGTSLSGGLDSSTIVCLIQQLHPKEKFHSISVCNEDERYSEERFIDQVLGHTGIKGQKLVPKFGDMLSNLDRLIECQDEPFWDVSKFAGYQVFQAANQNGLKVMLNGQGADEILAGYDKFYKPFLLNKIRHGDPKVAKELFQFFSKSPHSIGHNLSTIGKALKATKQAQWIQEEDDAFFQRSSESNILESSLNMLTEVGVTALLRFEDRNAMAHSVETRMPFLDHRLVEFSLKLPDRFKIRGAVRKYILREAFKDLLPVGIYKRYDKQGFTTPDELWLKQYPDWTRQQLEFAIQNSNGLIMDSILEFYDAYLKNKFNDYTIFWRAIFFGNWLRVFNVKV